MLIFFKKFKISLFLLFFIIYKLEKLLKIKIINFNLTNSKKLNKTEFKTY